MKRITIHNLGPIRKTVVELEKFNVVIGPQSSGKSCLLKTASYCVWVEKQIQISQKPEKFGEGNYFLNNLVTFHKLQGYLHPDTAISYESDFMAFSYTHATREFKFQWKDDRWSYVTPKISYIPAERNMVAVIPNWFDIKLADDNIRSFMSDWQNARTSVKGDLKILNLGVAYHYEATTNSDQIRVEGGPTLDFTNTSSGLQSLIPIAVQLEYLTNTRFQTSETSIMRQSEYAELLRIIRQQLSPCGSADVCQKVYENFTGRLNNMMIIEEPEQNLFPPTQSAFIYEIVDKMMEPHGGTLMMSTHSPYVVTALLERNDVQSLSLLVVRENEDGSFDIVQAAEEQIQQIYDDDIDAFHNISSLGE